MGAMDAPIPFDLFCYSVLAAIVIGGAVGALDAYFEYKLKRPLW